MFGSIFIEEIKYYKNFSDKKYLLQQVKVMGGDIELDQGTHQGSVSDQYFKKQFHKKRKKSIISTSIVTHRIPVKEFCVRLSTGIYILNHYVYACVVPIYGQFTK